MNAKDKTAGRFRLSRMQRALLRFRCSRDLNAILDTVDAGKLRACRETHVDRAPCPGSSKYLDIAKWMKKALYQVYTLDLHKSDPARILDIGTGCGYFPYACTHFGHDVETLDMDVDPMYREMIQLLGVRRKVWQISPCEKLPDCGRPFDLVTAFMICFNNHGSDDVWGPGEWSFFLQDLANRHLTANGQVWLELNPEQGRQCVGDELAQFFCEHGAVIRDAQVRFMSLESFRHSV